MMGTICILSFMRRALGSFEGFHVGVGGVAVEGGFHLINTPLGVCGDWTAGALEGELGAS